MWCCAVDPDGEELEITQMSLLADRGVSVFTSTEVVAETGREAVSCFYGSGVLGVL